MYQILVYPRTVARKHPEGAGRSIEATSVGKGLQTTQKTDNEKIALRKEKSISLYFVYIP